MQLHIISHYRDRRERAPDPRPPEPPPPPSSFFRPLPSDLAAAAALAMMKGGIEAECSIILLFPWGKAERERRDGGKKRNFVRSAEGERRGREGERARAKLFSHKSGYGDLRSANRIRVTHTRCAAGWRVK